MQFGFFICGGANTCGTGAKDGRRSPRIDFEEVSMIESLCDRGHMPYRQIGHRAVASVMRYAGIEHNRDVVPSAHMSTTGDPS